MKLVDALLLSASVGFLIIGIFEIMRGRFAENYWILMLMFISFFTYAYRKNLQLEKENQDRPDSTANIKKSKNTKKKQSQ